jgi:hypothetical protein
LLLSRGSAITEESSVRRLSLGRRLVAFFSHPAVIAAV